MAIIIALLAALGTGSTIFYFLHKRRNRKRIYGVVIRKSSDNVVYIGYHGKQYTVHTSDQKFHSLIVGRKVTIKVWSDNFITLD